MFENFVIADKAAIKEMMENNEEAQINNPLPNQWVELVKTPATHFSHATSSMSIEKEMEYLAAYGEE